jgi:hypothetical protein
MSLAEVLSVALEVILTRQLLPLERLLLDLLAILILGVIDFIVIDVRGIVIYRSFLLVSCSHNSVVKLEYLLIEFIVLLVCVFNLADSVSDCVPDSFGFLLGIFILAIDLYKFLPKVVDLFLEERSI